jgi:hypothetical protein
VESQGTLTINYIYTNGTAAAESYFANCIVGETYSVTSPTVTGYAPMTETLTGTMTADDVTVTITYLARLNTPTIALNGSTISWEAITGASKYSVYANDTKIGETTSISYDLGIAAAGTYSIYIKAEEATGICTSYASNTVTYIIKLNAPVISLNGSVVSWNAVSGANRYSVYSGEIVTIVTGTSFDLSTILTETGSYTVYVKASNSTNSEITSKFSNSVTYTR